MACSIPNERTQRVVCVLQSRETARILVQIRCFRAHLMRFGDVAGLAGGLEIRPFQAQM
jgi:hypothetical protein